MQVKFITRKRKHIGIIITTIMLAILMSATVFASEMPINKLHNVSTEPPEAISTYGLSKPSTDKYVDLNDETLTFQGNAQASTLYTNKHFTGKAKIGYSITNDCDSKLTVKFYTSDGWFKSKKITIEGNATLTGTMDGFDADELYYLTFSAPSDFNGSVY